MATILARSDFALLILKHRNISVFRPSPIGFATYSPAALARRAKPTDMARDQAKPVTPVLYLLMSSQPLATAPVERAMGLWQATVSSSGPSCRTFTSFAPPTESALAPFYRMLASCKSSVSTITTAPNSVSDLLGQETVVFQTMSRALDSQQSGISHAQHHTARALLTPMRSAIFSHISNCSSSQANGRSSPTRSHIMPMLNSEDCMTVTERFTTP